MTQPTIALIIVNWNGKHLLGKCLSAVFSQTRKDFCVYLVDNGSMDGSILFVRENFPSVKIIPLTRNYGFAKGNNVALGKALSDPSIKYIALLNNDTEVYPDWLEEMVLMMKKQEALKCGMVSCLAMFPDRSVNCIGLALQRYLRTDLEGGISIGWKKNPNQYLEPREIFCPSGVGCLLSAKMLKEIGCFDENFFAYGEDIDLGFRARLAGWRCFYNPRAKLIHYHSQTGKAASPLKAFLTKRNGFFVAIKNSPFSDWGMIAWLDFRWNIKNYSGKHKNSSVSKLKKGVGGLGLAKIMIHVYFSLALYFPKMLWKRLSRPPVKISFAEYLQWTKNFSRENLG